MKTLKNLFLSLILFIGFTSVYANNCNNPSYPPDEGMWLPMWIGKLNIDDMHKLGFRLSAEHIYSINNSSMKDAIVGLGQQEYGIGMFFCTGEIVSDQGLLLTNHHCAYDAIQKLSSIDADYLTDGFWAYNQNEELPIPGMTASILVRMEDVTEKVLEGITHETSESQRNTMTAKAIKQIEKEASENKKYNVHVKSFFEGSEYYLFVYQTFLDIRLVGAPPSSIGKFGGDTDNWMWPRHTGDFSYLRIYAAPDGTPAEFNKENEVYKPKHHFPVSVQGVKENDFSMIFGFPGSTDRYLTSHGIDFALKYINPSIISIRDTKLDIMKSYMDKDPLTRIQYASKHAQTANYWKYHIGQTRGLKLHNVADRRKELEDNYLKWAQQDADRQNIYGSALNDIETGYEQLSSIIHLFKYLEEAVFQGPEFVYFSFGLYQLYGALMQQNDMSKKSKKEYDATIMELAQNFKPTAEKHFKDYNANIDKDLFVALFKMFYDNVDKAQHPDIFATAMKKHKNSFESWANDIFKKSILVDEKKMNDFLAKPSYSVLSKDPGWLITMSMITSLRSTYVDYADIEGKTDKAYRLFIEGLRKMQPEKKFYPNANSTIRMTYGKVLDYYPADAVHYDYITTMKGIIEKEDPNNEEFVVPERLMQLIKNEDFGIYGKNGELNICFLSDNDITGGNSGSPVINANGHLIGIAFDGNWESMSGDIQFEPSVQRTISVDIRYVLFITDKFAGATNLINEMTLIK